MGRWAQLDTDEERLPEGMTRVGYDADSQIYTYRDSNGSYWEGAPGCRYGKLFRVRSANPPVARAPINNDSDDDESSKDEKKAIRTSALPLPSSLTKTHAHALHHPAPRPSKALPDLLSNNADRADTDTLSGTTVRDSICSTTDTITSDRNNTPPPLGQRYSDMQASQQGQGPGLKRSGTLSRIARFLSSSSSPSSFSSSSSAATRVGSALSRRATVADRASASASNGAWPRARVPTAAPPGRGTGGGDEVEDGDGGTGRVSMARRKRATTFDEILGRM